MPNTVPHQKVVYIHREKADKNFIQISKDNFYKAYQDLNSTATMLYLYLAGNMDGYKLAFSPEAVKNSLGMPQTTCRDQVKKLLEKGYLTQRNPNSNVFDFHEIAQTPQYYPKEKEEKCAWKTEENIADESAKKNEYENEFRF